MTHKSSLQGQMTQCTPQTAAGTYQTRPLNQHPKTVYSGPSLCWYQQVEALQVPDPHIFLINPDGGDCTARENVTLCGKNH